MLQQAGYAVGQGVGQGIGALYNNLIRIPANQAAAAAELAAIKDKMSSASKSAYGDAKILWPSQIKDHSVVHLSREYGIWLGFEGTEREVTEQVTTEEQGIFGKSKTVTRDVTTRKIFNDPIKYNGKRHIISIAPSRAGKGTTAVIPTLLDHSASMVVVDPKGQNAAVTAKFRAQALGNEVFVVNPFGLHIGAPWGLPKHRYNPLDCIDPSTSNFVADISALAEALIVGEGHGKDSHWADAARDLVSGVLMYLKTEAGEVATLPRMRQIITMPTKAMQDILALMSLSDVPAVRQRAGRFLGIDNQETQSVMATARTQTSFLDDPAIIDCLSASDFDFGALKQRQITIYVVLPSKYLDSYSRFTRLMVVAGLSRLMDSPPTSKDPVLFVMDEFAALGYLKIIESAMAYASGYGVQLWPILQDTNQVRHLYSDRWETFLANAGVLHVLGANDMTTAEYLSRRSGTYGLVMPGYSQGEVSVEQVKGGFNGRSDSSQVVQAKVQLPQDYLSQRIDRTIVHISGVLDTIIFQRAPYYAMDYFNNRYMSDPYHLV